MLNLSQATGPTHPGKDDLRTQLEWMHSSRLIQARAPQSAKAQGSCMQTRDVSPVRTTGHLYRAGPTTLSTRQRPMGVEPHAMRRGTRHHLEDREAPGSEVSI